MNEIRSRIQDALLATRSAAEQGLVAGGGVALLQAASALDGLVCENAEEQLGIDILRKALEVPLRALAENAAIAATWPLRRSRSCRWARVWIV